VPTPDGTVFSGYSMISAEAMIKLNGLQHDLNIGPEDVVDILMDKGHPQHREIKDYLIDADGGPVTYKDYTGRLNTAYNHDFSEIQERFREKYPDLDPDTQADMLPLEVLQYVVDLAG
jgi:hypothetical protein